MTSTIKRRPRGYRTGISREVFEFVMKLLQDTIGTTGRYLDLMRGNAPLRIQGPDPRYWSTVFGRQFYRWGDRSCIPYSAAPGASARVDAIEYRQHRTRTPTGALWSHIPGSIVPYRHTYNATRII